MPISYLYPVCELPAWWLYGGAYTPHLPDLLQPKPLFPWQDTADLCSHRGDSNTERQVWLSLLWGPWVLVHTRFCLTLWASLVVMRFDSKHDFASPTVSLWLLLCPRTWGIFFQWDPTLSCRWLFNSSLQFWSSHGEDECTSFYSTILWDLSVHWVLRVGESVQLKCCPARKGCSPKVLVLQCWFHLWRSAPLPPCLIILSTIRVC